MYADKKLIDWILFETKEKNVSIARNTTLSEASIRDLRTGRSAVEKMQLQNAASLTEYASKLKEMDLSE